MKTLNEMLISAKQACVRSYFTCDKKRVVAIAAFRQDGKTKYISSVNGLIKTKAEFAMNEDRSTGILGPCCPYKETPEKTCMGMHAEQLVASKLLDRQNIAPDFVLSSHCPCVTCVKWLAMAKVPRVLFIEHPIQESIEFASKLNLELIQVDRKTMLMGDELNVVASVFELQHRRR